jgi:hypothetical protein
MKSLTDLLLNYPIPGVRALEQRRVCAQEAGALVGYPLTSKDLLYKNETLTFSVPPLIKSALILKQEELLKNLGHRGIVVRSLR